ncbi:MAG: adenylate/guanylate cyclase domain-containing protein [Chloroflexota bacterium]|nr:adenylate/guanylate cyclase domain-containing protein [Chloroflexota bacterium]
MLDADARPHPDPGVLAVPFKLAGVRISRMNPNLCNLCETKFRSVKKAQQVIVPATVLFADVRGYTSLSEEVEAGDVSSMLGEFYDRCSEAIWERDGIVNKLIGDAIIAIYNFPISRQDHVKQAALSGIDLQRRCQAMTRMGGRDLPVGVGIHAGDVAIGEIGRSLKDFTAIGEVVNLAARLQGASQPGEVLVTEQVYREVERDYPAAERRTCTLKGIAKPVTAYVLRAQ